MPMDPGTLAQEAAAAPPDHAAAEAAIRRGLIEGAARLLGKARHFLRCAGLASGAAAEDLARDAIQDVARRALESAGRYLPARCPVQFWLEGILLNVIKQLRDERLRHRRVYPGAPEAEHDGEDFDRFLHLSGLSAEHPDPEARSGARDELARGLAALPAGDREVLELSILHEMDYDEIAARLGVTPGAARTRRSRALTRLRRALSQKGGRT